MRTLRDEGALILYGIASRYVYEVVEIAERAGRPILAYVHNQPHLPSPADLRPTYTLDQIQEVLRLRAGILLPMVTPGYRKQAEAEALAHGFTQLATLIDPTAVVARRVMFGDGFQVNAGVVIGANGRFGRNVQINRSASVGHDTVLGDYATLGPGCILCGSCEVGRGTFVGAGATLVPKVRIGENAIIGAGAVVVENVPANTLVVGNPARVVRTAVTGYHDVGV